jgi:hypothetical protein
MSKRRGRALRRRYGRAEGERKTTRVLASRVLVNDAPGGHKGVLEPGDRVEVGGLAANENYLIAYRAKKPGGAWVRLGPFATVPVHSLRERGRR